MSPQKVSLSILLLVMALGIPVWSYAQNADIWVTVGTTNRDNVTNPCPNNPNCVVLAPGNGTPVTYGDGTGGTITIVRLDANASTCGQASGSNNAPACVERMTDGDIDYLVLRNARITRTAGPVSNFPITFRATHQSDPPAVTPNFFYKHTLDGSIFSSNNTSGNSISINGNLDPQNTEAWTQYSSYTYTMTKCLLNPPTCTKTFSSNQQSSVPYSVANPRGLKGEVRFTLNVNNDRLHFFATLGGVVKSGAQEDVEIGGWGWWDRTWYKFGRMLRLKS